MNIEETLDAELRARKINLSEPVRRVCLTVIKAVLAQSENAVTPCDGTALFNGAMQGGELSPEAKARLEKALAEQRCKLHQIVIIDQPEIQLCPKHGEVMDEGRCRACPPHPHAKYEPSRDL